MNPASAKEAFFRCVDAEMQGHQRDLRRSLARQQMLELYGAGILTREQTYTWLEDYQEILPPDRWKCAYCAGTHPHERERCSSCGAPRQTLR